MSRDSGQIDETYSRVVRLHQNQQPSTEKQVISDCIREDVEQYPSERLIVRITGHAGLSEPVVVMKNQSNSPGPRHSEVGQTIVQCIEVLPIVVGKGKSRP